mmetsp:Transcript_4640/g.7554  ORF Transcript_4640/g.7554 Transcript_4640/m.7554 type:complete len:217 (-) Transcript_4640:24-674(-)
MFTPGTSLHTEPRSGDAHCRCSTADGHPAGYERNVVLHTAVCDKVPFTQWVRWIVSSWSAVRVAPSPLPACESRHSSSRHAPTAHLCAEHRGARPEISEITLLPPPFSELAPLSANSSVSSRRDVEHTACSPPTLVQILVPLHRRPIAVGTNTLSMRLPLQHIMSAEEVRHWPTKKKALPSVDPCLSCGLCARCSASIRAGARQSYVCVCALVCSS